MEPRSGTSTSRARTMTSAMLILLVLDSARRTSFCSVPLATLSSFFLDFESDGVTLARDAAVAVERCGGGPRHLAK